MLPGRRRDPAGCLRSRHSHGDRSRPDRRPTGSTRRPDRRACRPLRHHRKEPFAHATTFTCARHRRHGILTVGASAAPRLHSFGTGEVTFGAHSITLANDPGEYSGVYLKSKSQSGKKLANVSFSFSHGGGVAGGAPRLSIPIADGSPRSADHYAFLDAINCGLTGVVDTDSPNCAVFFGSEWFANWDAFAAAHPTYRIKPGRIPFVIADQPGTYVVSDVDLR